MCDSKTPPTLAAEHGEASCELTRKFSTQQLAFVVLACAVQAGGGERYQRSHPTPDPTKATYQTGCTHVYNCGKIIHGVTDCSRDWI